jgi:hypothetical protein
VRSHVPHVLPSRLAGRSVGRPAPPHVRPTRSDRPNGMANGPRKSSGTLEDFPTRTRTLARMAGGRGDLRGPSPAVIVQCVQTVQKQVSSASGLGGLDGHACAPTRVGGGGQGPGLDALDDARSPVTGRDQNHFPCVITRPRFPRFPTALSVPTRACPRWGAGHSSTWRIGKRDRWTITDRDSQNSQASSRTYARRGLRGP